MGGESFGRRQFLREGLSGLVRGVEATARGAARALDGGSPPPRRRTLLPPGARAASKFFDLCTKCDDCIDACPAGSIQRDRRGFPALVVRQRACVLCADLACTHVCEPGALVPLQRVEEVRIGLAVFDHAQCLPWQLVPCPVCREVCPTDPKAIEVDEDGRPSVVADLCTGCGLCEERCPTTPAAVVVEPLASATESPPQHDQPPSSTPSAEPSVDPSPQEEPIAPGAHPAAAVWLLLAPTLALLGLIGFGRLLGGVPVQTIPNRVDWGDAAFDFGLLLLFILPHSLLARGSWKVWLNRPLGPSGERPLYVLIAGATLCALCAFWKPVGPVLWDHTGVALLLARTLQVAGMLLAGWAAIIAGAGRLIGLPHLRTLERGTAPPEPELTAQAPFRYLRQPLNLGILLLLLGMPEASLDRLLLAVVTALWILFVAPFEERDALRTFGDDYRVYRDRTPRWIPRPHRDPDA